MSEMIPQGKYRARARRNAEFGQSSKGSDFVLVKFDVTQGPHEGELLYWRGYFTDATQHRTVESLRYCGCTFPGDDITNLEGIDANEVELVVEHDEYNGAVRPKVQWVNSLQRSGGLGDNAMSAVEKKSFAARMRGTLMQTAENSDRAAQVREKVSQAFSDADIPF